MGLFPKNDRYFEIFEDAGRRGDEVATAFAKVASANGDLLQAARTMVEDHSGRTGVAPTVMRELEGSFITPFDRDDMLALAFEHDDAVGALLASSDLIVLHQAEEAPHDFAELGSVIARASEAVGTGLRSLRSLKTISFGRLSVQVTELVDLGLHLERCMLAEIYAFESEHPARRALQWQGVLDRTAAVLNHLRSTGRILESTVVKYS